MTFRAFSSVDIAIIELLKTTASTATCWAVYIQTQLACHGLTEFEVNSVHSL